MSDIITIAQSTFYRTARLKALYVILVICVLEIAAMSWYGTISGGMEKELMFDYSLALSLIVALITSMSAAFEVPRELRERTAQFILSKPMGRSAFIWGKWLGVSMLVVFNIAFIAVGSLLAYKLCFDATPWDLLKGAALVATEGVTLAGIGVLLSVFLSDSLAAIGVFVFFAVGHAVTILPRMGGGLGKAGKIVQYVLPNFYNLDVKTELSHGVDVPNIFLGSGILYGLAYALFAVGLSVVLFSRKDIQ